MEWKVIYGLQKWRKVLYGSEMKKLLGIKLSCHSALCLPVCPRAWLCTLCKCIYFKELLRLTPAKNLPCRLWSIYQAHDIYLYLLFAYMLYTFLCEVTLLLYETIFGEEPMLYSLTNLFVRQIRDREAPQYFWFEYYSMHLYKKDISYNYGKYSKRKWSLLTNICSGSVCSMMTRFFPGLHKLMLKKPIRTKVTQLK